MWDLAVAPKPPQMIISNSAVTSTARGRVMANRARVVNIDAHLRRSLDFGTVAFPNQRRYRPVTMLMIM
ncbi:hypothetical protein Ntsu_74120 [Nocardia sp. IFM 10818]